MEAHLKFSAFSGSKVHLGVSGSISAYKALDLLRAWQDIGLSVSATLTESAQKFVSAMSFSALGANPVYKHMFAEGEDPLAHLEPGVKCDAMVIAPASATTLARLASGLADEMLSAQALACDRPLAVAPAMNPRMWSNLGTQANWDTLLQRGVYGITPALGRTACMECGEGRLADLREIFLAPLYCLAQKDLSGLSVLLTLGPTREFWDGVRFLSNPSSGIMGSALAIAAYLRGAKVTAVCGPGAPWLPKGITRVEITSALDMEQACFDVFESSDIACFCAAVADFRPAEQQGGKVKKAEMAERPSLALAANPDILFTLGHKKSTAQKIIAFAAETENLAENALAKLKRKNADILVANLVNRADSGFGSAQNQVTIFDRRGREENLPLLPKPDVAWKIWDFCQQL